ncbi:hypothetical protein PLCT2_02981 [Planctomycetaceae bacterium]|nr:hypothetical protein PLCT2_02981 [Planctomycetaceae bacterium]
MSRSRWDMVNGPRYHQPPPRTASVPRTTAKNMASLEERLTALGASPPRSWSETGLRARPHVHGMFRYPAMMVPRMQGDILDAVLLSVGSRVHVMDPFVGSGTTMTESLMRGLRFTGVDINPLATLTCEAKLAIHMGVDVERAARKLLNTINRDRGRGIDVDFPNRDKWFSDESAIELSRLRRAICSLREPNARKVMWVVFSETVRVCSNSRTSTYKLHVRPEADRVPANRISGIFGINLAESVSRACEYQELIARHRKGGASRIICDDIRNVDFGRRGSGHRIIVTSPPYGDNESTIPYGQFSYLALRWIPSKDLHGGEEKLISNTHSLDTASLGGSRIDADQKQAIVGLASPTFEAFASLAGCSNKIQGVRKVASFAYDFLEALATLCAQGTQSAHWILTTGNRTVSGLQVPFDGICRDIVEFLGGKPIATLHRRLPNKRMPSRNSMGAMITDEATLIAEFY